MEYLILFCIIPITESRPVANSRMPLVNNLHAPLVAELDVSNMNKELKEYIDLNIKDEVNYTCHARIQTVVNETLLELKSDMLYNYTSTLKTTKNFYDGEFAGLQKGISMQITRLVDSLTKENEEVKHNLTTENKEWKVDFKKELEQLKSEFNEFKDNITTTLLGIDLPVDCSDLIGLTNKSDVYLIHPKMLVMFKTYCDMETDGGGWTVFQRRFNGQTDFYRGWEEYKEGFGDPQAELWMGNSKLSLMTSQRPYELRINLEDYNGAKAFAKFSSFSIGDASTKYKLTVAGYSGTAGDSLNYHNNQAFTTKDSDNDQSGGNCATDYKGGWWYNACHYSNLNGLYGNTGSASGMAWYHWKDNDQSMKTTSMMIRRKKT